jgi:CheY-like chemotaxis protein
VEDDKDSREILAKQLSFEGATVTSVGTAREALPFLSSVAAMSHEQRETRTWLPAARPHRQAKGLVTA